MPENKSKFLIPTIGAAVVVIAGSVAAYLYLKTPVGDALSPLASAKVVPDDALMAGFITTDAKAWSKLQQFGTPEAQKLIGESLQNLDKEMLSDSNISYEKDLKPWVGSVMFAILPPNSAKPAQSTPQTAQREENVLLVVGIKDKLSALNFAKKLKEQKDVKTQEIDYKGVKITQSTGEQQRNASYTAVLNDRLVVGFEQKAVEQAIDTFKGEPSFASKEGANTILAKGVDVENAIAQFYIPDYASVAQQLIANSPSAAQLPPDALAQLKQVKSVVAGLGVDDVGLRMKAVAKLDPQAVKVEYQPAGGKVISQFPADTIALITGQGIDRGWSALVEQSQNNPQFKQGLDQARLQLQTVNIDLDKDIFSWMNGEFAFAAIPSNQGLLAGLGFGGALVFDTSDRQTAEATLSKLDGLAKTQLSVAQRDIDGKAVTEWQIPNQGALLGHGWLDNDTVFVAIGGPISDAIATKPSQPLDQSENFQAATESLQKPNGGYLYLDMDKTLTIFNRFAQAQNQPLTPETSAVLSSIRGIGITGLQPDKSTSQVELLLALKPASGK